MFRKTYSTDAIEWKGLFMVKGVLTPITLSGGKSGNGRRIKARFTTADKVLQDAIESDPRYKRSIFFEAMYEEVKEKVEEEIPGKKVYTENRLQDAQNILVSEYGAKLNEVSNKAKILEFAKKKNVVFSNIK